MHSDDENLLDSSDLATDSDATCVKLRHMYESYTTKVVHTDVTQNSPLDDSLDGEEDSPPVKVK